jgi:cytoskeletal protein CcmA (bactofilin family)
MFSKSKGTDSVAAQSAPAPSKKGTRAAPSLISSDVVLTGNITAGGDIQVDGTVEGDIRSVSLTIGEKASIQGEIVADDVVVRGRILGSIRARRVQLCSTCHVEGNILHEALAVETGAFFEGNCRHSADPMTDKGKASSSKAPARDSIFSGGSKGDSPRKASAIGNGKSGPLTSGPTPVGAAERVGK